MDWNFLKSKLFWLNTLAVITLIVQQATSGGVIPLKYASYVALAVTILSDISAFIQNGKLTYKNKIMLAKLQGKNK